MRISEIIETAGVGRVVPGVNMPAGMHPDEISRQAAKFGNRVDRDGRPPVASTNGSDALGETDHGVDEAWSKKYKKSISCNSPKGFSQRAHCAGRHKRQAGGQTSSRSVGESRLDAIVSTLLENLAAQGLHEVAAVSCIDDMLGEDLRKWFRQKWVRFGPDGKIRGACARGSDREGKPKCLPQSKAHALGKKGRATAARRKRREDPNAERKGKARNVATRESDQAQHIDDLPMPSKLYHVTRSRNRLSIRQRGLVPKIKEYPHISRRPGIFVFETLSQARDWAYYSTIEEGDSMDVWQIDLGRMHGLQPHADPSKEMQEVYDAWVIYEPIPPSDIKLVYVERYPPPVRPFDPPKKYRNLEEGPIEEKKDACYHKVKRRYKVWPSAYASGALVQCRKKGAKNWGNKGKK